MKKRLKKKRANRAWYRHGTISSSILIRKCFISNSIKYIYGNDFHGTDPLIVLCQSVVGLGMKLKPGGAHAANSEKVGYI